MLRAFGTAVVALVAASTLVCAAEVAPQTDNPHGPLADTCETCHAPDGWRPVRVAKSFDHARFRFPLEGTHLQTTCRACHLNLVFKEVASACVSCHQDAHRGELGDNCALCHTPRSFIDRQRMRRAHQTTRFPLVGAHAGADCEACHTLRGNQHYVNTPTDCASCHIQDYNATQDPDHALSGFSQNCQDCHNTVAFRPATFPNHDAAFFPIFSGRHRGVWSSCSTCHVTAGSFSEFSCFLGCHTHANSTEVANQHTGVSGYSYTSSACYGCHPSP